jgi:hypothetical protein
MRTTGFWLAIALVATACNKTTGDVYSNSPPQADAGADVTQPADQAVHLDGRGSYDPDGDPLDYHWTFDHIPEGSSVDEKAAPFSENNDGSAAAPTFQPDVVGVYVIKLEVYDGTFYSQPSYVVITATAPGQIPVADAGPAQSLEVGEVANLNGNGSYDPLGGQLAFAWTLVEAPSTSGLSADSLTGADTATPSFSGDVAGNYTVTLTVENSMAVSLPDSVQVTYGGTNGAPTATVSDDFSGEDCTTINLSCAGADPEGDPLTYYWELQSKPAGSNTTNYSFTSRSTADTSFWPDVAGVYTASCSTFDGQVWSAPDTVAFDLAERGFNSAPVVDAGTDFTVAAGEADCEVSGYGYDCDDCPAQTVEIGSDGGITDPDGDPFELFWVITDGSATLSSTDDMPISAIIGKTTPDEPGVCAQELTTFQLSATDCPGETTTDDIIVTVECCGVTAT